MPPLSRYMTCRSAAGSVAAHKRVRLARRQRRQPDRRDAAVARRRLERREQGGGHLPLAEGQRDQDPRGGGRRSRCASSSNDASSAQCTSSSTRTTGRRVASLLQQRADRPVGAEPLVLQPTERPLAGACRRARRAPARPPGRRSAPRDGHAPSAATWSSSASTQTANGSSRSSSAPRPTSTVYPRASAPRAQLGEQPRLTGARLAADHHPTGGSGAQPVERSDEAGHLLATPDEGAFSTALYDRHGHGQATR